MLINRQIRKNSIFWFLNISGWLAFALIWLMLIGPDRKGTIGIVKFFISNFTIAFVLSIFLRHVYRPFHKNEYHIFKIVLVVIVGSFFSAVLWYVFDFLIFHLLYGVELSILIETLSIPELLLTTFNLFVLLCSWSILYFTINLIYDLQEEKLEKEKALFLATESKMEMLKNQINPHFLFNSLNSISALVIENQDKAQLMIDKLSEFLRFTLANKHTQLHPFNDELRIIKHYLNIQEIRFEENLQIIFDIDSECEEILLPVSILYPIVENAVKHGINTSNFPLQLTIAGKTKDNYILISIKNSGSWIEPDTHNCTTGTGTGIQNVKERLACEYGSDARFVIIRNPGFVEIQLTIPKKKA